MTDVRALIGPLGMWGSLTSVPATELRPFVAKVSGLGYGALWVGDGTARDPFALLAAVADAAGTMALGTSIVNIFGRDAMAARMGAMTLHELTAGRFLLGLGVSHAPMIENVRKLSYASPYTQMVEYLAAMAEAPFTAYAAPDEPTTVIAALGPRMLELARTAADGAHPYFSPVEHTAKARQILGEGKLLAPELMVAIDDDPDRARELAVEHMTRYLTLPNYVNNLLRQGFEESDVTGPSDRLIDAIVVCGTVDDVVRRVGEQHDAGADHVCVQVLTRKGADLPMSEWADLADAFGLRAA